MPNTCLRNSVSSRYNFGRNDSLGEYLTALWIYVFNVHQINKTALDGAFSLSEYLPMGTLLYLLSYSDD